jgi:MFS family permease
VFASGFRLNRPFWLLLFGSTVSMAGIGGVSQHLKLIFREAGYGEQSRLDAVFGWTMMAMLTAGAAGRFLFAWGAERFPKRSVITVAFLLMAGSLPLLLRLNEPAVPFLWGRFWAGNELGLVIAAAIGDRCAGEHGGTGGFPSLLSLSGRR